MVVLRSAHGNVKDAEIPPADWSGGQWTDELGLHRRCVLSDIDRLHVIQSADASGTGPFDAVIPLGINGLGRLESLHRLLAFLHHLTIPPDTRMTGQQRLRASRMLRAADGHADGATQKEIAQELLHVTHVDRDSWQESSARYAVMALLRDARKLIASDYRKLLRHRRRT